MESSSNKTLWGIAWIVVAVALMALGDALVKAESANLSLWQIYLGRGLVAVPLLALLAILRGGQAALKPQRSGWVWLRSLLLVLTWGFYYSALPFLDLALAAVALYTAPLFIALISSRVAGQPVGRRRWLALLLGFAGVLISLRPDGGDVSGVILLPLAAAICYAAAMVITAERCVEEAPITLSLILNLALLLCGVLGLAVLQVLPLANDNIQPFLLDPTWQIESDAWPLLALLGLLIVVFSTAVARAYQLAPAPLVAIFDYSYLLFAALWSALFFAESPSLDTAAGMAIIALAGLVVIKPGSASRAPNNSGKHDRLGVRGDM